MFNLRIVIVCLIITLTSTATTHIINQKRQKIPQVFIQTPQSNPCAKVLDKSNNISRSFCNQSENSIQKAVDYAQTNNYSEVKLDPGIFTIRDKTLVAVRIRPPNTTFDQITAGIYIPSNIHLSGSTSPNNPTLIRIAANFKNYYENEMKALIFVSGSKTDSHIAAQNVTIENIELSGKTDGIVKVYEGLRTNDVSNLDIKNIYVHDTLSSGIVLGGFSPYEQDQSSGLARLYSVTGKPDDYCQVTGNRVNNVGGDGISVTGNFIRIADNTIDSAYKSGVSNGIGVFSSTSYVNVENNRISNSYTGIGSDGSYPYYHPYSSTPTTVTDIDTQGKNSEIGFNKELLIRDNIVSGNQKGIVLWRSKQITVANNTITGNKQTETIGINLNESRDNAVWGNKITNLDQGIFITGNNYSPSGSINNTIGFYRNQRQDLLAGNAVSKVNNGIVLNNSGNNSFKSNWVANFKIACSFNNNQNTSASGNQPLSCNTSP